LIRKYGGEQESVELQLKLNMTFFWCYRVELQLTQTSAIHDTPQVEDKLRPMSINAPNFILISSLVFL
jgi:hypothetical protein